MYTGFRYNEKNYVIRVYDTNDSSTYTCMIFVPFKLGLTVFLDDNNRVKSINVIDESRPSDIDDSLKMDLISEAIRHVSENQSKIFNTLISTKGIKKFKL